MSADDLASAFASSMQVGVGETGSNMKTNDIASSKEQNVVVMKDVQGPRGGLTAEKARELFEDILSGAQTDFTHLTISTWAWSAEAAQVAAEAVAKLPHLHSVYMGDIIAGRPEAEALEVYRILSEALVQHNLKLIDLSDNAIGPKGLAPLRTLLTDRQYLEEIYFCNCGISAESAQTIAELLLYRTPTKLRVIEFFNNMSGSDGAIATSKLVEASPDLEKFRFASSRCGREGGVAIAKALRNAQFRHLDLHDNTLGVPTAKSLAITLLKQRRVEYLDIGDVSFEQEGLEYIASALLQSPSAQYIEVLDLSANDVEGEEGAQVVAALLRRLPRLRVVSLDDNEFGNKGARIIAKALEERTEDPEIEDTIERLRLNGIGMYSRGALAVARAAASMPNLQQLFIDENFISAGTVETIESIIQEGACSSDALQSLQENDEEAAEEEEELAEDDGEEVGLEWEPVEVPDNDDE